MLTLADFVLDKFGGDSIDETRANLEATGPGSRDARGAGRRRQRARARPTARGRRREGRLRRRRLGRPMDLVLVGLPGSGKSVVGRRLAARHGARVHRPRRDASRPTAGRTIAELFEAEGEAGLPGRASARRSPTSASPTRRPSCGASSRPAAARSSTRANRWALYRGRRAVWLNGPPEVLAQRLRNSPNPRPLLQGRDPIGAIRELRSGPRAVLRPGASASTASPRSGRSWSGSTRFLARAGPNRGTPAAGRRHAASAGSGSASPSQPGRWPSDARRAPARAGRSSSRSPAPGRQPANRWPRSSPRPAWPSSGSCCRRGEAAKRLAVIEAAAGELARLRVERGEPLDRARRRRAGRCRRFPRGLLAAGRAR